MCTKHARIPLHTTATRIATVKPVWQSVDHVSHVGRPFHSSLSPMIRSQDIHSMSGRTCRYTSRRESRHLPPSCVRARARVFVCVRVRACVCACVRVRVQVRVRVRVRVTKKERYIRAFSSTSPPGTTALAERRILRRDACARAARPTRQGVIGGHHAQLISFAAAIPRAKLAAMRASHSPSRSTGVHALLHSIRRTCRWGCRSCQWAQPWWR